MNTRPVIRILMSIMIGTLFLSYPNSASRGQSALAPDAVGVPSNPIPESSDYATLVLRDAWDIDQPSDISQYMNESGQRNIIQGLRYEQGLLKGVSVSDGSGSNNGYFFPLYSGYGTAIKTGKVGYVYPISSATYNCLYIAMKVDSPAAGAHGPDMFQIHWFPDEWTIAGEFGYTGGIRLYPEAGSSDPSPLWKLYSVNLSNPPTGFGGAAWNSQASWQRLRIAPTVYANVPYEVDWIRLTDCGTKSATITFTPNSAVNSLWVRPQNSNRYILVATDVKGASGTYNLDTQGLTPGQYDVALGNQSNCCTYQSQKQLVINHRAIADFDKPSFTSGQDYAASTGNPWDFQDSSDVTKIQNIAAYSFSDGNLDIVTNPGPLPGGQDARLELNTPVGFIGSQYRYLTFDMSTEWHRNWQNVPAGMMARWIWTVQNPDGSTCTLVSQDIPYDIGQNTLTVDLYHSFNGSVEQKAGSCGGVGNHWKDITQPVIRLRFDPNENITSDPTWNPLSEGSPFYQQIDSIHLTRADQVVRGDIFPIRIRITKSVSSLSSITYYYTKNLDQPRQQQAESASSLLSQTAQSTFIGKNSLFLPVLVRNFAEYVAEYDWHTGAVSPGEYYICAEVDDGYNKTIYCSETPVVVTTP